MVNNKKVKRIYQKSISSLKKFLYNDCKLDYSKIEFFILCTGSINFLKLYYPNDDKYCIMIKISKDGYKQFKSKEDYYSENFNYQIDENYEYVFKSSFEIYKNEIKTIYKRLYYYISNC